MVKYRVVCRYNCNRYDEEEARKALDAQEVRKSPYPLLIL